MLSLLLALASPARSDEPLIPAEYRGEWCMMEGHPYYTPKAQIDKADMVGGCQKDGDGWIKIGPDRYEGWEFGCKPTLVTWTEGGHVIKFHCYVEGNTDEGVLRFTIT